MIDPNQQIDPETQKVLNTPLKANENMTSEDEQLLNQVVSLVNEGKINLYQPSTLVNQAAYSSLSSEKKGQVDYESMNLLTTIREIKGLYDAGFNGTYQISNLVSRMRTEKERIETERGDIFII